MALDNEKEVVKIITKLYKAIDASYLSYLVDGAYNYMSDIIDPSTINKTIAATLTEQELNILVAALSDNEVEVNKLIVEYSNLDKFFKRVKDANTQPVVRGIVSAYTNIKDARKREENFARSQKEKRELYKAARLTPRQKQVLTTIGISLASYEKTS